jgi:hypothetical protein
MRQTSVLFVAVGTLLIAGSSFGAEPSPYKAEVLDQGAEVRAGPGRRFYVTQELEPGAHVEVYRREAGDWLAIRPPEGSFSWIPESDLEMTADPGIAEVTPEETKSWIGSRAQRIREHKSHVSLARGERVEVLGKKQVEGEGGQKQLWMKIAPPAGEFRWVHISQVQKTIGRDLARGANEAPSSARQEEGFKARSTASLETEDAGSARGVPEAEPKRLIPRSNSIILSDMRDERVERGADRTSERLYPVQQAAHEENLPGKGEPLSPDGFVPRRKSHAADVPTRSGSSSGLAAAPTAAGGSRAQPQSAVPNSATVARSSEGLSRELEELDLKMSLMLARDKSTWNFSAIKERVEQLVESAATPADRGEARFMLEKIKQFEDAFDVHVLAAERQNPAAAAREMQKYDGEGWLTTVKSADRPVAPYALVDKDGRRICFVSPAPGLNISRHLEKHVGLLGKRGLIPDLNVPHVLASQVVDLDRQLR